MNMATGSGKTTVMAMLIRVADHQVVPKPQNYGEPKEALRRFLVSAPGMSQAPSVLPQCKREEWGRVARWFFRAIHGLRLLTTAEPSFVGSHLIVGDQS